MPLPTERPETAAGRSPVVCRLLLEDSRQFRQSQDKLLTSFRHIDAELRNQRLGCRELGNRTCGEGKLADADQADAELCDADHSTAKLPDRDYAPRHHRSSVWSVFERDMNQRQPQDGQRRLALNAPSVPRSLEPGRARRTEGRLWPTRRLRAHTRDRVSSAGSSNSFMESFRILSEGQNACPTFPQITADRARAGTFRKPKRVRPSRARHGEHARRDRYQRLNRKAGLLIRAHATS